MEESKEFNSDVFRKAIDFLDTLQYKGGITWDEEDAKTLAGFGYTKDLLNNLMAYFNKKTTDILYPLDSYYYCIDILDSLMNMPSLDNIDIHYIRKIVNVNRCYFFPESPKDPSPIDRTIDSHIKDMFEGFDISDHSVRLPYTKEFVLKDAKATLKELFKPDSAIGRLVSNHSLKDLDIEDQSLLMEGYKMAMSFYPPDPRVLEMLKELDNQLLNQSKDINKIQMENKPELTKEQEEVRLKEVCKCVDDTVKHLVSEFSLSEQNDILMSVGRQINTIRNDRIKAISAELQAFESSLPIFKQESKQ